MTAKRGSDNSISFDTLTQAMEKADSLHIKQGLSVCVPVKAPDLYQIILDKHLLGNGRWCWSFTGTVRLTREVTRVVEEGIKEKK